MHIAHREFSQCGCVAWQSSALFPTTVQTVSGATGMNLSSNEYDIRKGTPTSGI